MSMNKVYALHRLKKNNFEEYKLNFVNSATCQNAYLQCKNILCKSFVTNQAYLYPLLESLSTSINNTI